MSSIDPEQERLLDHEYDGIREYDNPMPRWWVWIFWGTIVFSVVYAFEPTKSLRGPGRLVEYEKTMADAAKKFPSGGGAVNAAALLALRQDPKALELGKTTFATNCSPCHRPDGGGIIGPNLTDDYWLHGGTLPEIRKTINDGVLEKGMPNWGKMLKPEQVNAVAVYVSSLHGSHPPNPKAPQGVKVETP